MNWTDFETIIVQGRDFAVMVEPDDSMRAPWEEYDGHGIERAAALSMGIPTVGAR